MSSTSPPSSVSPLSSDSGTAPRIAVVVATHDRASRLPRLLEALEQQKGAPAYEVVVVDDASSDDTWEVLHRLRTSTRVSLTLRRLARNAGPASARNLGWRESAAPLVAFTDDDCTPEPGWLAGLAAGLDTADVVQGRTIPDPDQLDRLGPFSRTLDVGQENGYYQTCNVGYRRGWLERVGGFEQSFRLAAGEDTDLAWRARRLGATASFRADAVVRHDVRPSDLRVAVRDARRWQGMPYVIARNPELRRMMHSPHVWRRSHREALPALAGIAAVLARRRPTTAVVAAALTGRYAWFRAMQAPLPGAGPRRRWLLVPGALLVDAAEIAACARGSVRHRTLVL